jgi:mono/diheme cytochrome c family protein
VVLSACSSETEPQRPDNTSDDDGDQAADDTNSDASFSVRDASIRDAGEAKSDAGPSGATTGLPCDVQTLLVTRCQSCHGSRLLGGAPMRLVTLQDLSATSPTDKSKTNAQLSLVEMEKGAMPPAGALANTEVALFASWVNQGAKAGSCGGTDAGGAAVDPGDVVDPFDTAVTCSSGTRWTGGDRESPLMHPGAACISCHARGEGPRFTLAGTVYQTGHEPNDCNGTSAKGVSVVITDAKGVDHTLAPNAAGNFFVSGTIAKPYKAKLTYAGRTRAMASSQTDGDCNSCHTESGDKGAPGRLMLP